MAQNILYYSNYCKHSQKVLNILIKASLENEIEFICIDKRGRDPNTNQIFIVADNGKKMLLPPNVHSVPALLLVKDHYRAIYGDEILQHYESKIVNDKMAATQFNGEPMAHNLGGIGTAGSFGTSFDASYSGKLSISTPPEQQLSTKIKMGDDSALSQYEQQRRQLEKQMGIGQQPTNPFTMN
jgi:hypothetical protein